MGEEQFRDSRGESTPFRVKNGVVHSRSRRTVHVPSVSGIGGGLYTNCLFPQGCFGSKISVMRVMLAVMAVLLAGSWVRGRSSV